MRRVPPAQRDRPVPILMYHVINEPPGGAPLPELYVPADDFAAQMNWLKEQGYQAVTLQRAYDFWTKGVPLPRRPVVLTFDDGYRSVGTNALPVLRRLRWPGVLNLQVDVLEKPEEGWISEPQVRQLIKAGWEIDSHTVTHPVLTTLDDAQLTRELVDSREQIRRRFGQPARFFCYPAGAYDPRVVAAVKAAGYQAATTVNFGVAGPDQLLTLNRVRVDGSDGLEGFQRKVTELQGAEPAPAPESFSATGEFGTTGD